MSTPQDTPPTSRVEPASRGRFPLVLPALATLFAAFLAYTTWFGAGPVITVFAEQGHGLGVGDPLRYRGVTVGEVQDIALTPELERVAVRIRLEPASEGLCREGSRFWVVRPHMALDSVQGLETIIGARYLSVLPGDIHGAARYEFTALADPPVPEAVLEDGLELVLEAPTRFNIVPGAQVTYRGVSIGTVLGVDLASDATTVEVRAYVRPEFRELVRVNTYFWSTGGLEVNLALTQGLSVEMDSLRSLLVGGISIATPTDAGALVEDGARFTLNDGPHEDAEGWRPALAVGGAEVAPRVPAPRLLPVSLEWREGRLFKTNRSRAGWALPVGGGVLAPANLLESPDEAIEGTVVLRLDGAPYTLDVPPSWSRGGLAFLEMTLEGAGPAPETTRLGDPPEDCLVLGESSVPPLALAAARLTADAAGWRVDPSITIEESWHGAAVVGRSDGRLLGLLLRSNSGARVVPLEAEQLRAR